VLETLVVVVRLAEELDKGVLVEVFELTDPTLTPVLEPDTLERGDLTLVAWDWV